MTWISKQVIEVLRFFTTLKPEHAVRFVLVTMIVYILWNNNRAISDMDDRLDQCETVVAALKLERDSIYSLLYIERDRFIKSKIKALEDALEESRRNAMYARSMVRRMETKIKHGN